MEWTPFAGLTALDENDEITIDGGSFLERNPRITDTLLRIGAKTHRHDAHAGLDNPLVALSGAVVASGGSLPPLQSYGVTYTLLDDSGGETTPAPVLALATGAGLGAPQITPSATPDYTQGIMPAGAYYYGLTYTDGAGGETTLGPVVVVSVDPGYASGAINLDGLAAELISGGGQAVSWRLWRSIEGADWHLVTEDQTDTFLDDGFDPPDNPAQPPASDTTQGASLMRVTLPTAIEEPALIGATAINVYLAPGPVFISPALYATFPVASAGATFEIAQEVVSAGSPPHVSTSIGGADKIDPDTELLDFPWKRPVATMADLPTGGNTNGDMREALDTHALFIWDSGSSAWIETGGAGPPGAPGDPGDPGASGTPGRRGSLWFVGHGAPGVVGGALDQDFYVDVDTNDYYSLLSGAWSAEGTLAGGSGGGTTYRGPYDPAIAATYQAGDIVTADDGRDYLSGDPAPGVLFTDHAAASGLSEYTLSGSATYATGVLEVTPNVAATNGCGVRADTPLDADGLTVRFTAQVPAGDADAYTMFLLDAAQEDGLAVAPSGISTGGGFAGFAGLAVHFNFYGGSISIEAAAAHGVWPTVASSVAFDAGSLRASHDWQVEVRKVGVGSYSVTLRAVGSSTPLLVGVVALPGDALTGWLLGFGGGCGGDGGQSQISAVSARTANPLWRPM